MGDSKRLYEGIARALADAIERGEYGVGLRLPSERELAQSYKVSRATIREAMIALELDGLVEVRTGAGVFVIRTSPPTGTLGIHDVGPFELLEARRAIEGEACAMAAARITDAQLGQLNELLGEMRDENEHDVKLSEDADRRFHELIAAASDNSAMITAVAMLWDARERSPQIQSLSTKVRALGVKPRIEEHLRILESLERRDPAAARSAMREHLTQVLDASLHATETEEIEKTRTLMVQHRKRFSSAL